MRGWLKNTCATLATATALMMCGAPTLAHHAFSAEFDAKKPVHLEGIVTKVELINPHAWIHLDVQGCFFGADSRRTPSRRAPG